MLILPYTIPGGVACIDSYGPTPGADHKEISFINFWNIFWNVKTWIINFDYNFQEFQVFGEEIIPTTSVQGSGSYTWFSGDPGSPGQGQGQQINSVRDFVCRTNTTNMFASTTAPKCSMILDGSPILVPGVRGFDLRSRRGKYYAIPAEFNTGYAINGLIFDPENGVTRIVGKVTSAYLQAEWPVYGAQNIDVFVFTWPACSWTIEPLEFWDWVTYT